MKNALMNFSGGKDSCLALFYALKSTEYCLVKLLTSVSKAYNRVSMHGVHEDLLLEQSLQIGLPLEIVYIPEDITTESYKNLMKDTLCSQEDINVGVFGDIFLEDLKVYRQMMLSEINWIAEFPLWKKNTFTLLKEFWDLGFKTKICSVDGSKLNKDFLGIDLDEYTVKQFPKNVDICGENGEFHTFVYDGPIFKNKINLRLDSIVSKEYRNNNHLFEYHFAELIKI